MMKRFALVALPLAPFAALLFFWLFPALDPQARLPLFHFHIVTFTTFAALVLSILLSTALSSVAEPRHVLAAVAFAAMGALFFSHGFATPGALIAHRHPALNWSAWLTLFSGGFLFALASVERPGYLPRWLSLRRVVYGTVGGIALYMLVVLLAPAFLLQIDEEVGPWHRQAVFFLTLLLWLFAAWNLWQDWRVSRSRVDGALTFVALWLTVATISMHQFPVWNISWWLYHFLLLMSFLMAFFILVLEHEQARQFRLMPYYIAFSLIFTVLLTLAASDLFSRFSYSMAAAQQVRASAALLDDVFQRVAAELPARADAAEIRDGVAARLLPAPAGSVVVYDLDGRVTYPADATLQTISVALRHDFEEALAGERTIEVLAPDEAGSEYGTNSDSYLVASFAPIPGPQSEPVGVLQLLREAPELNEALLRSRGTALGISALMMTGLFTSLLLVVQRANRIIATRTEQLDRANQQSDALLLNILPAHIAAELKQNGRVNPVYYEAATVLFTDVKDFTQIAATLTPQALIGELDYYFSRFDEVIRAYGLEKLKTIGDSYMCAGGVPVPSPRHAVDVVRAALEIQALMCERQARANGPAWEIRIGIHSGPLVAGVIGQEKFAYDVWGETVNTADRMEKACEPGKINISHATYELVKDEFSCEYRGKLASKDGVLFDMYFVVGPKR